MSRDMCPLCHEIGYPLRHVLWGTRSSVPAVSSDGRSAASRALQAFLWSSPFAACARRRRRNWSSVSQSSDVTTESYGIRGWSWPVQKSARRNPPVRVRSQQVRGGSP